MKKKSILFLLGVFGLATIGATSTITITSEGLYAEANNGQAYSYKYELENFKNNEFVSPLKNHIKLYSKNGEVVRNDDGTLTLPQGFRFGNLDKFSGITKFYGVFEGELNFSVSYDTVKSEPNTNTITNKFLAHQDSVLTSGIDYIFNDGEQPSFYEFVCKSNVKLTELYVNYSCEETALPDKYLTDWYLVGNIGGKENWDNAAEAIKFDYHVQNQTHIAEFATKVELHSGDIFKVRNFKNSGTWLDATKFNYDGVNHILFDGKDACLEDFSGDHNIKVLKDGVYSIFVKNGSYGWINYDPVATTINLKGINASQSLFGKFEKDPSKNEYNLLQKPLTIGDEFRLVTTSGAKDTDIPMHLNSPALEQKYLNIKEDGTIQVLKTCTLDFYYYDGKVRATNSELDAIKETMIVLLTRNGETIAHETVAHNNDEVKLENLSVMKEDEISIVKCKGIIEIFKGHFRAESPAFASKQIVTNEQNNVLTVKRNGSLNLYINKNDGATWVTGTVELDPMQLFIVDNHNQKVEAVDLGEVPNNDNTGTIPLSRQFHATVSFIKDATFNIECGEYKVAKWEQINNKAFAKGLLKCSGKEALNAAGDATVVMAGTYEIYVKIYESGWVDTWVEAVNRTIIIENVPNAPQGKFFALYTKGNDFCKESFIQVNPMNGMALITIPAYADSFQICVFNNDEKMELANNPIMSNECSITMEKSYPFPAINLN